MALHWSSAWMKSMLVSRSSSNVCSSSRTRTDARKKPVFLVPLLRRFLLFQVPPPRLHLILHLNPRHQHLHHHHHLLLRRLPPPPTRQQHHKQPRLRLILKRPLHNTIKRPSIPPPLFPYKSHFLLLPFVVRLSFALLSSVKLPDTTKANVLAVFLPFRGLCCVAFFYRFFSRAFFRALFLRRASRIWAF